MASYNPDVPALVTYQAVVSAYSDFLTVAIHTILYERNIYPQTSFIKACKYNYPVRQSRHPKLCRWIQDAVAAVEIEMLKCTIAQTSLVIHAPAPSSTPIERYVFSTASFPRIATSDTVTPFAPSSSTGPSLSTTDPDAAASSSASQPQPQPRLPISQAAQKRRFKPPPTSDLPEQFRATFARLTPAMAKLAPLPKDCSFTLAIELRDEEGVEAPIWRGEGAWIAAEPGLQRERDSGSGNVEMSTDSIESGIGSGKGRKKQGGDLGGVRTTPVRALEAGAFAMEVWVEEGKGKFRASAEKAPDEEDEEDEGDDVF